LQRRHLLITLILTLILTLIMVLGIMDIMAGCGFQVIGAMDGGTTAGEESGIRDIGDTVIKSNMKLRLNLANSHTTSRDLDVIEK